MLSDLYAHALSIGAVTHNPAELAKPPATERVHSLALPLHMWIGLREEDRRSLASYNAHGT